MTGRPAHTIVIELRYFEVRHVGVAQVIDGMNDVILTLTCRLGLDVLSLNHVCEHGGTKTRYTTVCSTVVCMANGQTVEDIAAVLEPEKDMDTLYCFQDGYKLSVRVGHISYN